MLGAVGFNLVCTSPRSFLNINEPVFELTRSCSGAGKTETLRKREGYCSLNGDSTCMPYEEMEVAVRTTCHLSIRCQGQAAVGLREATIVQVHFCLSGQSHLSAL